MLELKGIHKYYNPGTVNEMCLFRGFDLKIEQGEFLSVVGSNGSGKTSMLNIICGSIPGGIRADPDGRKGHYEGERIPEKCKDRPGISESGYGNLSYNDDPGKYVSGGQ